MRVKRGVQLEIVGDLKGGENCPTSTGMQDDGDLEHRKRRGIEWGEVGNGERRKKDLRCDEKWGKNTRAKSLEKRISSKSCVDARSVSRNSCAYNKTMLVACVSAKDAKLW